MKLLFFGFELVFQFAKVVVDLIGRFELLLGNQLRPKHAVNILMRLKFFLNKNFTCCRLEI
jgi:hypothetical protein